MKQSRNAESAETGFFGSISSSSIRNLLPRSISSKPKSISNPKIPKPNAENTPPADPNIQVCGDQSSPAPTKQLQSKAPSAHIEVVESDASPDSSVKVVVRIRPAHNEGKERDETIKKVSPDTLSIADRQFTFDLICDSHSDQEDIFQSVGVPFVKNSLAGYNTSLLSYGQSGSGKTYTMWGPLRSIVEEPSRYSNQGMAPRIFRMLFSELQREQQEGKQFNHQCRCSFLEVHNEKIGDLLDPIRQNLELKEDSNNALYIENLTEEYVTSDEDVAQILLKGLSRRKVETASLDSESSRSHVIFTFTIESWSKQGISSKDLSSSKTSRISLIDLAGSDKNIIEDGDRLVDGLTKETQSIKAAEITNKSSCLTRLLQELLVGNVKLSVICSISSDNKSNGETLRTLRFGERIRSIRNKPVINEIQEDGANGLSDQIRQLKEELIREKANVHNSTGSKNGYFQGRNVRESLNKLRVSLNRSLLLPHIDNDTDEEVNVDEADIKQLSNHIDDFYGSCEFENPKDIPVDEDGSQVYSVDESFDADMMIEGDDIEKEEMSSEKNLSKLRHADKMAPSCTLRAIKSSSRSSISDGSLTLEPPLSESPKIRNTQRKSMDVSSSYLGGWNKDRLSQTGKILPGPTECLATSLQRGLQIIDYHQQNSALNKSLASFSFEHLALKPCSEVDEVDSSMKPEEKPSSDVVVPATFLCGSCGKEEENPERLKEKHLENEMARGAKREKELEIICGEQRARIEQLSQLVEKYKGEKDINSIVYDEDTGRQIKHEWYNSLKKDEEKLLSHSTSENLLRHISEGKSEIKEVQKDFSPRDNCYDDSEKEALLKEIQNLRTKLQLFGGDAPVKKSTDRLRSSLMSRSIQLQKSGSGVSFQPNGGEELEKERERWLEMESEWICLTDELRVDLECSRQHIERVEMELKLEKKSKEELDDALKRAVDGHSRMIEHYTELQEKYDDVAAKHHAIMEGIAKMKQAAAKAGKKGHAKFSKSLAAELSAMRVEREREREFLKKENRSLKIQLRDTAEAVHAAGELLVRLREAEHAVSVTQDNFTKVQEENEKLKRKIEKLQRKQKMEMITMKQYLAESKLPEAALKPLYKEEDSYDAARNNAYVDDDDQAWRAEFGAIYQEHY